MIRRTPASQPSSGWLPGLDPLIHAVEVECPAGHARALRELASLALTKVPARGIFDPTSRGEHDLFAAIDGVASRHLGMSRARAAWKRAMREARLQLETRDRIEHAAQQVQGVSDTAYFYAGLAFGLVCTAVYRLGK
jgi:hypothetical protein